MNHKRVFNIECTVPERNVGFTLPDADTGRYFWKLCVLQHTFFMKYEQNQVHPSVEHNMNLFANVPEDLNESRDNLYDGHQNIYASDSHIPASLMWSHQQQLLPQHHMQLQQQKSESVVSSNMSLATSQQHYRGTMDPNWTPVPGEYSQNNSNWQLVGSNTSLNDHRMQSTSCLDLSNNNIQQDRERLKAFLPGYRPAPDYETAIQQKYRSSESSLLLPHNARILSDPSMNVYSGSQPDVHRATAITDAIFGQQLQQKYPDVTQTTNPLYQQQFDPNPVGGVDGLAQQLQMMRFNKAPPPYQANRLSSTSTPDLASHRALLGYRAHVSGSSPDLVSTRTFLNPQFMSQQQVYPPLGYQSETFRYRYSQGIVPHGTYENLNFVEDNTKTNLLAQKIQQQNAMAAAAYLQHQQHHHPQANGMLKSSHHNGSIEPIYENIPLPWQGESSQAEMRDRASSIQSAPGVMRFKSPQAGTAAQMQQMNDQNKFKMSNSSLATISDLKNNNTIEHRALSKTSSNPIAAPRSRAYSRDSTDGNSHAGTIVAVEPGQDVRPEIIQPPDQFQHNEQRPIHRTKIEVKAANNHDILSAVGRSIALDTSQSSTFTNQTATSPDSGISIGQQKEKKKRRWGFFGGGSTSSKSSNGSDKQKSATLSRDKDKSSSSKSNTLTKEEEINLKHRWSTGLPRLQPLAATISKEKMVTIGAKVIISSKGNINSNL